MSAKTAARHTPDELTFHGIRDEVAVFSAASASRKNERNVIVRDILTGEAHCDCRGAEMGRTCWHMDWLETAWLMTQVAPFVATLADDELCATGEAAKLRMARGDSTVTDLITYYQCRVEYRARASARAILAAFPPELIRAPRPCPDCGEPTRADYLCRACLADLEAQRAGQVAA